MVDLMPRFFSPIYFVLFDGNFTVENGSQHSVGGLSSIPKFKKALVCLREKIYVLGKLCSGKRYSAVSCEFSDHKSMIY